MNIKKFHKDNNTHKPIQNENVSLHNKKCTGTVMPSVHV